MFKEFNETYDYSKVELTPENLAKSFKLINDEVIEVADEIKPNFSKTAAVKELLDTIYITAQQLSAYGVDIDAGLAELHRSNLSKTVPLEYAEEYVLEANARYPQIAVTNKGKCAILRCVNTGKVIKTSIYSPAVITSEMFS